MVKGLYIGATRAFSGKNMLSIGLGLRLGKEGVNLGYMKPVGSALIEKDGVTFDEDAFFVQDVLGLEQPRHLVTPVLVTQEFRMRALAGQIPDYMQEIAEAYAALRQERDAMLVCGSRHVMSGKYCHLDGVRLVRELGLKAIIIDRLQHEVNFDELITIKEQLGEHMIGTVLNDIPFSFRTEIESAVQPYLERNNIPVLGIIPRDPLMGSIRAHEVSERLGGRLLAAQSQPGRMVDTFLIGTMQVDNFIAYFRRHPNAAVIVGGDRVDIQLVAIEGNCPCLVLTGNLFPTDIILARAEALNVPIIMLRHDTYTVAKKMENILTRNKMRDVMKIRQGEHLVSSNLDFAAIRRELGV